MVSEVFLGLCIWFYRFCLWVIYRVVGLLLLNIVWYLVIGLVVVFDCVYISDVVRFLVVFFMSISLNISCLDFDFMCFFFRCLLMFRVWCRCSFCVIVVVWFWLGWMGLCWCCCLVGFCWFLVLLWCCGRFWSGCCFVVGFWLLVWMDSCYWFCCFWLGNVCFCWLLLWWFVLWGWLWVGFWFDVMWWWCFCCWCLDEILFVLVCFVCWLFWWYG